MSEWNYICVVCGYQVNAGVDFKENCLVCHSSKWLCHLDKGTSKAEISLGQVADPVETLPGNLSQRFCKPGPKPVPLLRDMVPQLAGKGLSSRHIADELSRRGIHTSYRTVARILAKQKVG